MSFFSNQLKKLQKFPAYAIVLVACIVLTGCDSVEDRIQSFYESGLKLVEEGKPVKAGLEFRNALKLNNDFVPALFELAKVEFGRKEVRRAVGFFHKIIEIEQNHLGAHIELAKIYLLGGQLETALKHANKAYALDADNSQVLLNMAAISLKRGNSGDAVRYSETVLKKDPQNIDALVIRAAERMAASDPKGALVFINKGPKTPKGTFSLLVFKLRIFETLKDKQGVEKTLIKLAAFDPKKSQMQYVLARWYMGNGRMEDAEKIIRKFSEDNPKDIKAGLNLVRFISNQKGKNAAKEELLVLIKKSSVGVFDYRMALASLIFAENKNQEAIDLVNKLIVEKDGTEDGSKARLFLAQKMIGLKKQDKAEELLAAILKTDEKHTGALIVRAGLQIEKGENFAAIENLLAALNLEPRSSRIHQLLAVAYERDGKIELAEEHLVKATAIEEFKPKYGLGLVQFLLRYGKSEHAESILTQIIEKTPQDVQTLTQLARAKLRKKDWSGADAIAETLQKADPKNKLLADQIRVAVLAGQEKYDDSIRTLKATQSSNSDKSSPTANLFRLYLRAEKYDEAEELIKTSLQLNPDDMQSYVRLGLLHSIRNRMAEAEAAYKTIIEKKPQLMIGYYAVADFYLKTNRLKEAEQTAKSGLKLQTNSAAMRLLLASIYERSGQIDTAIIEYEDLFKIDSRSTIVANNLASLLSVRGSDADLQQAYDIAYGRFRNSNVPQFLDTLGWIHYLRGEYGEAVSFLKTAAEKLPNLGVVQYHLGMAYKGLGRNKLAIASLRTAEGLMEKTELPERDVVRKTLDLLTATSDEKTKEN